MEQTLNAKIQWAASLVPAKRILLVIHTWVALVSKTYTCLQKVYLLWEYHHDKIYAVNEVAVQI